MFNTQGGFESITNPTFADSGAHGFGAKAWEQKGVHQETESVDAIGIR